MNSSEIVTYLETEYDGLRRVLPKDSKDVQMSYVGEIDKNVTAKMMPMVIPTAMNIFQEGRERDAYMMDGEQKLGAFILGVSYYITLT